MNPIDTALRELAGIRSEKDPIVTLYLDTRWNDQHQRDRVRLFASERLAWAKAQGANGNSEQLRKTLDRVGAYVDELVRQAHDEDAHGVAIFACEGLGLFRTVLLQQSFKNEFALDETPHLLQLARMADNFEPVIAVVVDAQGALIFETAVGGVLGEARIQHTAPRRHKMGGWSQLHFQRHVDQQIERNHKEAADHTAYLVDYDPRNHVVLVGPDRVVAQFEKLLPQRVLERVICRIPNPAERSPREGRVRDEVMQGVIDELLAYDRKSEEKDVEALVGQALRGGLAVLGPQDVCLAATEGRIHRLMLEDGFDATGWHCHNCNAIGHSAVTSCGYCGADVATVNLGEELARRVIENDGEVEVLDRQARLHHYHGIGAVLRHRGTARQAVGWAIEQPVF